MWFWSNKEVSPEVAMVESVAKAVVEEVVAAAEEVVVENDMQRDIDKLQKENEELKEKLKNHKSVLFEGALKSGRRISIQYYDEDDTFRVIAKKTNDLLFRSPDLSALIIYKKTNIV
jgi:predicted GNAT superfamily acetyltransferase